MRCFEFVLNTEAVPGGELRGLREVKNAIEPRYFEVPGVMEKSSKYRGFEITGLA